jgi:hypothetical protein
MQGEHILAVAGSPAIDVIMSVNESDFVFLTSVLLTGVVHGFLVHSDHLAIAENVVIAITS